MDFTLERECTARKIDVAKAESICRRLDKAARDAEELGLEVFAGSSGGSLRHRTGLEGSSEQAVIVADGIRGLWDGGDGATHQDDDGLWRGE